jgi:hypothetical protein
MKTVGRSLAQLQPGTSESTALPIAPGMTPGTEAR